MTPRLRKFALTAHVISSVGWLGAVVVFFALAVVGLTSQDAQTVRGAYLAMGSTTWLVLVPLAFASLLTGVVLRAVQLGRRVVIPFDVLEGLLGVLPPPDADGRHLPRREIQTQGPISSSATERRGIEMNAVHLIGRVVRDPELRYSKKGVEVCLLQLAVPRRRRDGEDRGSIEVDVVTFGSLAGLTSELPRGSQVAVSGRLGQREWTSSDGSQHARYEIVADDVDRLIPADIESNVVP
jgi:primosomal replication protein N